jgi:hypothetical protein
VCSTFIRPYVTNLTSCKGFLFSSIFYLSHSYCIAIVTFYLLNLYSFLVSYPMSTTSSRDNSPSKNIILKIYKTLFWDDMHINIIYCLLLRFQHILCFIILN